VLAMLPQIAGRCAARREHVGRPATRCSNSTEGLLANPRSLLLDEPSAGLSPRSSRDYGTITRVRAAGVTVMLVEQNRVGATARRRRGGGAGAGPDWPRGPRPRWRAADLPIVFCCRAS